LHGAGRIKVAEKNALKSLALGKNEAVVGAFLVYDVNSDEEELVDTLQKICHRMFLL
jgi:hypothetical protein